MGPKYEHFKFNIGDMVQMKAPTRPFRHDRMMVTGRRYEECPGGVQLFAICRQEHGGQLIAFLEIELEPFVVAVDEDESGWAGAAKSVRRTIREVKETIESAGATSDAQPQG